jgi:predicted nucleic acid-binding protein
MKKALIDTNILVYFADSTDAKKNEKARALLEAARDDPSAFIITLQNLREFGNVMAHKTKMPVEEINEFLSQFEHAFVDIASDTIEIMQKAVVLSREKGIDFYDANIFQTAIRKGITVVYTENTKDFERIPGLEVVNPLK